MQKVLDGYVGKTRTLIHIFLECTLKLFPLHRKKFSCAEEK